MPKIIAIDFDGTLCDSAYPDAGPPRMDAIRKAISERNSGAKLILWTCRTGTELETAVEWCRSFGLEFDAVNENLPEVVQAYAGENPRKVSATEYWDDRAFSPVSRSCENCKAYKHTSSNKRHPVPWCANTCKNYRPKEEDHDNT